jgi:hypothetical protein
MTKFAQLIAKMEGFGKPGAIPTLRNNPGDLRHSPHSSHDGIGPDDIGIIDTVEHGWEDLERQLALYAERGMTMQEAIYEFAPPNENDTANYLRYMCAWMGMDAGALMSEALQVAGDPADVITLQP